MKFLLAIFLLSGISPAESGNGLVHQVKTTPPPSVLYVPPRLSVGRTAWGGIIVSMPRQTNETWIFEATLELGTNAVWHQVQNLATDGKTLWTETAGPGSFWRARRIQ